MTVAIPLRATEVREDAPILVAPTPTPPLVTNPVPLSSAATFAGGKSVDSGLGQGNLRPGGKKSGQVCFDKQGGGTPEQIIYQGGLFGEPVVWRK